MNEVVKIIAVVFLVVFFCVILAIIFFPGRDAIVTTKAVPPKTSGVTYLPQDPEGVRVYPPRLYLIVTETGYTVEYWPDYTQPYDIKPRVFLGKHDFKIEIENGQVKSISSSVDTGDVVKAVVDALPKITESATGIKALTLRPPEISVKIGLKPGVYRLEDDGKFHVVEIVTSR